MYKYLCDFQSIFQQLVQQQILQVYIRTSVFVLLQHVVIIQYSTNFIEENLNYFSFLGKNWLNNNLNSCSVVDPQLKVKLLLLGKQLCLLILYLYTFSHECSAAVWSQQCGRCGTMLITMHDTAFKYLTTLPK